jgi:glycosyltransferase involved in cell wall biosynthesis
MWAERPPSAETLNSFDVIVTQAEYFADDLRRFGYQGRIQILPYLPPECRPAVPLPPASPLRIGFLGRLAAQKNLPYLLEAFALLRLRTDAQLHLFGDGPERENLARIASALGIAEHVRFHGLVEPGRVARAVDTCHLFAFGSTTEGQCLAALEILARGRPVVATPVGAFPDFLTGGQLGALSPLGDPAGFATALSGIARRLREGDLTPEGIQNSYKQRFPRGQIIDEYARLLQLPRKPDAR